MSETRPETEQPALRSAELELPASEATRDSVWLALQHLVDVDDRDLGKRVMALPDGRMLDVRRAVNQDEEVATIAVWTPARSRNSEAGGFVVDGSGVAERDPRLEVRFKASRTTEEHSSQLRKTGWPGQQYGDLPVDATEVEAKQLLTDFRSAEAHADSE